MNGIIGMTYLALTSEVTPEQREYLETVQVSAQSLLAVINDILDFSKVEARELQINPVEFDLPASVQETLQAFTYRAQQKGLKLSWEIAPGVPVWLISDPLRLRQILTNLLNNAIKFTDEGEVSLRVSCVAEEEKQVILDFSVRDTGIGIAREKHKEIFLPFRQVDNSSTRRFGGTGLGLSISQQLATLLGGAIGFESESGKGSTFHVRLPFGKPAPAAESSPADSLSSLVFVRPKQ